MCAGYLDQGDPYVQGLLAIPVQQALKALELQERGARSATKAADDVLDVFRQQTFAMRRWIVGADSRALHKMMQSFFYVSDRRVPHLTALGRLYAPNAEGLLMHCTRRCRTVSMWVVLYNSMHLAVYMSDL